MYFANEHEILDWNRTYYEHPILGAAAATLSSLVCAVNSCSDGWPYWQAPQKAARKLVTMLYEADHARRRGITPQATVAQLNAAYRPIKAFRTRCRNQRALAMNIECYPPTPPTGGNRQPYAPRLF